ncbi:MAG: hypothetical protein LIO79_04350 [Rikenellaceae bacterium]|nr:hypothetical protein [Rikenellaceae bacterium]
MKIKLTAILLFFFISNMTLAQPSDQELREYITQFGQSPVEYVVSKFQDHDYVLLGEYHRLKHDVELVAELIPNLYNAGVYYLCSEFGRSKDQNLVDSLLSLPYFDRTLAQTIMFNSGPDWGYKEYIDIFQSAWETNHSNSGDRKFRIVLLEGDYDPCKEGGGWGDDDPDSLMAEVVIREVIDRGEKALIYAGNHHSFTRYYQPRYDFKSQKLYSLNEGRMGNIIYHMLGDRVFNIYLHSIWTSDKGWDEPYVLPVNGKIDEVMDALGNKPVGFDVKDSPFGLLVSTNSYYALGYPDFILENYCDGYIFQKRIKDYEMVAFKENFFNEERIIKLKEYFQCLGIDDPYILNITAEQANMDKLGEEDIREHFGVLLD